jgi:6,7-dimethyl-8-ribityllumazine synthase
LATALKNLSDTSLRASTQFRKARLAIVVSEWNSGITSALLEGARSFLLSHGVKEKHLTVRWVPGSFELPLGAQYYAEQKDIDAVLTLGCVIQGETRHFDFICQACADGVMRVGLDNKKPVIFGVLTTGNEKQARERAGGKHGNKGIEAAETALKMLALRDTLRLK